MELSLRQIIFKLFLLITMTALVIGGERKFEMITTLIYFCVPFELSIFILPFLLVLTSIVFLSVENKDLISDTNTQSKIPEFYVILCFVPLTIGVAFTVINSWESEALHGAMANGIQSFLATTFEIIIATVSIAVLRKNQSSIFSLRLVYFTMLGSLLPLVGLFFS